MPLKKVKKKPTINECSKQIISIFDAKPMFLECDYVVIENQPCMKNPTMKSIQMILYTYFLQNGYISKESTVNNIHLVSARKKLKYYDGPAVDVSHIKNKYSQRKTLSIEYTKYLIKDQTKWLDFFLNQIFLVQISFYHYLIGYFLKKYKPQRYKDFAIDSELIDILKTLINIDSLNIFTLKII